MIESAEPSAPADHRIPTAREVLGDRDVRTMLIANSVIFIGVSLQLAVLSKEVFDISGREIDLAWLGLAEFAPAPFLMLVTGTVADRFDRRRVAACSLVGELACISALGWYSYRGPTAVWPFFVLAALFGAFRAFNAPAVRSMPPMVAPDGGIPRTLALFNVSWTSAGIIGAAISGVLYLVAPWVAYSVAASLVLVGLVGLLVVKFKRQPPPPETNERPTFHHAIEGLRFIRRTPLLFSAMSLDLFAVLFGGAVALLPAIAEKQLHVGDIAYGWLRAAPGIGGAAMGVFLSWKPLRRKVGSVLLAAVGVFGLATVVLGFTKSFVVAFLALVVLSGADMVSVFVRSSLVPLITPDGKRGRVLAVENVFIGASNELGAFESGIAAQHLGLFSAVAGGGFLTIGVVLLFWFAFPTLRTVDRFEDLHPAE